MTFTAENVDPFLCTHIMYAFGKVVGNTIDAYEWNDKGVGGQYERIMNLRTLNPNLKILLAIGGWSHGTAPFTAVVIDPNNVAAFAANTLEYLKTYKFDGLDLDWEYPGGNGSPPEDKQRFTSLVQKLRQVFNDDGAANNRSPMLLTAAVAAGKSTIDKAYEVDLISKDLDFINLMSYDLHGSWEATTGHHSALYGRSGEVGTAASMNVDYAVKYWINLGAPPHKLVLGLGLYGRSFTLSSSSNTIVGAPAAGAGIAGTYTGEAGLLAFYEVCYNLKYNGWTRQWHSEHQVPYAYSGNQWIGYDDVESFNVKIDYIIAKGLGGGMVWSLDQDDFSNSCGDGSYPLMNVLRSRLSAIPLTSTQFFTTQPVSTIVPQSTTLGQSDVPDTSIVPSTNSQPITTHTTKRITTKITMSSQSSTIQSASPIAPQSTTLGQLGVSDTNSVSFTNGQPVTKQTTKQTTASSILTSSRTILCGAPQSCVDGQLYGDSCDHKIYYQCASGVAYQFQCAAGTVWDERIKNCNWDYLVLTSPTPCGCGPPSTCIDGQFYEDKCDMKLYYQCAHGIPYPYECHTGTLWDTAINNCNWDYAVPNRAPPTGSDCTSQGPITTGTILQNTEQMTSAPAKMTTNINLSTVGPSLTPFSTTVDQTITQLQSTLLPKTDLTTSSVSCGAPKPCVDGKFYGDSCDPKIYYQCASGVAYQFQCGAGTVWDERIKNCNWDYLVLTSPTPCGCGPPSTCIDGQFYDDKCVMKLYYQCAHGIPYPYECHTGTLWDTAINSCNWDYAVPNRAPPTGSDCTSQGPITTGTSPRNIEQMTSVPASLTPFSTTVGQTNSHFLSTIFLKTELFTTTAKTLSFVETSPSNLFSTYSSKPISSNGSLKTDQYTTPVTSTITTQQQVTTLPHTATSDSTLSQAQQQVTTLLHTATSDSTLSQAQQQVTTLPHTATSDSTLSQAQQQVTLQSTDTTTNSLLSQTPQQLATRTSTPSTDNTQSQIQQQTSTNSRIAVTDSTHAQSSQQTQTFSPIAASDSTRQQTAQSHSTYSNTKDTTSTSYITTSGNPFSTIDAKTTTQPSGITNSVWSSQIPQQTTTNAPSTSDPTPQQTTTESQTTTCGPPKTCPFPAWDSGSMTLSAHTLTILTGVLIALTRFSS